MDGNGNVYVAGSTYATWGSPQRAFSGNSDAFVAKLNSLGQLVWNTFLGGNGWDYSGSIAVDGSGNVYVTSTSGETWGSPKQALSLGYNAHVAKLDSGTGQRVWSTLLGHSADHGQSIAVDGSGNVYVTGTSTTSWGSPLLAFKSLFFQDAFVAQLDSSGKLIWNAFLGGLYDDSGRAIALDGSGNVYVTGTSVDDSWGSPLRAFSGDGDAFVAKIAKANFANGTLVKLTASPVAGYQFSGWGGACSGHANSCAVTMDAAKSVTAHFAVFNNHRSAWKRALFMQ